VQQRLAVFNYRVNGATTGMIADCSGGGCCVSVNGWRDSDNNILIEGLGVGKHSGSGFGSSAEKLA